MTLDILMHINRMIDIFTYRRITSTIDTFSSSEQACVRKREKPEETL